MCWERKWNQISVWLPWLLLGGGRWNVSSEGSCISNEFDCIQVIPLVCSRSGNFSIKWNFPSDLFLGWWQKFTIYPYLGQHHYLDLLFCRQIGWIASLNWSILSRMEYKLDFGSSSKSSLLSQPLNESPAVRLVNQYDYINRGIIQEDNS